MKNIKEAAKRCGNELIPRDIGVEPHTGEKYDRNEFARTRFIQGYEYGINAFLEEIERAKDLGEPPYLISKEQAYNNIEKLIEELKKK